MKIVIFIVFLFTVYSCKYDKPIEIYKMSNLDYYHNTEYYVIYNHEGKSKNELINSMIDYNKVTISLDTILKYGFFCRFVFLKDKILTKDYKEGSEDVIQDNAEKYFIGIIWTKKIGSDTILKVKYIIADENSTPYKEYGWKIPQQRDSLLNPIPRR